MKAQSSLQSQSPIQTYSHTDVYLRPVNIYSINVSLLQVTLS